MEKVTLFLMTKKGYDVLSQLLAIYPSSYIYEVILAHDRKVKNDYYSELKLLCEKNGIASRLWKSDYEIKTRYSFAVSWKWLINNNESKLIVLHDSILPRYRGFAPLVNMLINGEKEIGVTALFATAKVDSGDIIGQRTKAISYPIKISEAIDEVSLLYVELIDSIFRDIDGGTELIVEPQSDVDATYSLWRDEEDYLIDWSKSSEYIKRFIDSVGFPYLGAKTYIGENVIRILDSEVVDNLQIENRAPGKVIQMENGHPIVVCGTGLLKLNKVLDINSKSLIPFNRLKIRFGSSRYN